MKAGTYELNTSKDSKELIDILKESPEDAAKEDTKCIVTENRLTAYINSLDQGMGAH